LDRRRLKAVEIFSSPQAGIDCAQFRHLVAEHRPKVCILTVTNRFPTGTSYSEDVLKSLVQIAVEFETLIVENDMFSELSYDGNSRCLKQFDANDTVVQFSSFANFIAPEYGLGWVVAGKYAGDMEAVQFTNGLQGNDAAMQQAIADYLNSHSHDRQLRRVRRLLVERMREGLALVKSAFPASVQVSKPSGGYMCWLRLPKQLSSMALLDHPDLRDSKFLPGPMFSVAAGFSNYIALNFSGEWTPGRRRALQDLGRLVADLSARPL
jgi:DNA-binding transcriptional MocR family regulator